MGGEFHPGRELSDVPCFPRRSSALWKAPLPGWEDTLDEASARVSLEELPPIFFRADAIGVASRAFDLLCRIFRRHEVPLAMAVIPAWVSETRQTRLFRSAPVDERLWNWHQQGWRHTNWQKEGYRSEFGPARSPEQQHEDILSGRAKMERNFGPHFLPVFSPPWNRLSAATLKVLQKLDFKAVSAAEPFPRSMESRYGIRRFSVLLDLHSRTDQNPAADFALLIDQLCGISKMKSPAGIAVNHHLMTQFAFEFLDRLLFNLKYVMNAKLSSFKEMLKTPDEKPPVARLR